MIERLKFFAGGEWIESKTQKYMDVYNPSTGEVIAQAPCCTSDEVKYAIECADKAYKQWKNVPPMKRAQILFKVKQLIDENIDELTLMVAKENGKVLNEAYGDVLKAREVTELACGIPTLMMGESIMDASSGYDTVLYREPLGVFAGIVPFNFPAMIPMGWMTPLCIAAGNTIVLKAASMTPMTCMKIAQLYKQAGLPDGVLNIVTCSRNEAEILLEHEKVKGVTFVGSTSIGKHIYQKCASHGKRVQALCEAKNHALVLNDAVLERTAQGIVNAYCGCAGERCMALPVVVAENGIADKLVETLIDFSKKLKVGPAYHEEFQLGPLVTKQHRDSVARWIEKGIEEGAKPVLDGRNIVVKGFENGFYLGPTILDYVTPEMSVGNCEIFGPVLCVKRVSSFDEGVELINANPFANGAVIYTQNGYYAREFANRIHGGMVGVNVGIPVPISIFPFSGHKDSFFGDLHTLGKDGVRFYTETKVVTTHWFKEKEKARERVDTWDGTI
jgi:malonate-semialdehyde dehydrogenase (acetylating)/methylmalonate-semialdehyde dehydrogenase